MPCTYYSPGEEAAIAAEKLDSTEKKLRSITRLMNKHRRELDKVTRLLCEIVGEIEGDGYTFNKEVTEWWEKHKKLDALREKEEKGIK